MNRLLLGKEIKRRRVELKLTQKQLASGICKQSIISKIENGELFPSFEIIAALSNKLKLSINYLLESAISEEFYYIDSIRKKLNSLTAKHKYEEALIITNKELQSNEFLMGEHKDFFISMHTMSAYFTNSLSFNEGVSIFEKFFIENNNYINQELKLINRNALAILYADNDQSEKAIKEFEKILIEYKNTSYNNFYLKVLFNYANFLHNCGFFEKTLLIIDEGFEACKTVENANMFGKFYFLKGECLIDLGYPKDEIKPYFEKALFYFDLLHLDDYIKILWDTYYDYL